MELNKNKSLIPGLWEKVKRDTIDELFSNDMCYFYDVHIDYNDFYGRRLHLQRHINICQNDVNSVLKLIKKDGSITPKFKE